jgi:hypothetical protein
LGIATSTLQFSRSIGGTLGVSVLGMYLSARLASELVASGLDPNAVSLDSLVDPLAGAAAQGPLRDALAAAVAGMFLLAFIASLAGLLAVLIAPRGRIAQLMKARAAERGGDG